MISEHLLSNSFRIAIQDQFFTMNHSSFGLTNSIKNQFVFFFLKTGGNFWIASWPRVYM